MKIAEFNAGHAEFVLDPAFVGLHGISDLDCLTQIVGGGEIQINGACDNSINQPPLVSIQHAYLLAIPATQVPVPPTVHLNMVCHLLI